MISSIPKCFRADSMLGVPGLMESYKAGNVALANAPGTAWRDDKVIYAYVPRIVKYYLGEDIILPNVPTYICAEEKDRATRSRIWTSWSSKPPTNRAATACWSARIRPRRSARSSRRSMKANPRNYIAQPTLALSRVPTIVRDHFEGRHVDLRPYILYGKEIFVLPGGLTRVALKKGSLVVNSSQGGGSKDTWVLADSQGATRARGHQPATLGKGRRYPHDRRVTPPC
jgi:uncharacterized circularly permuted ATP-grasp superfamily protein